MTFANTNLSLAIIMKWHKFKKNIGMIYMIITCIKSANCNTNLFFAIFEVSKWSVSKILKLCAYFHTLFFLHFDIMLDTYKFMRRIPLI